jgi:catechol 2,3-dioxygenase-like lactoylglutathione lyase family enzyme
MTDFTPRRDVQAISHINVVVDDIEVATEFYCTVLGFEQAANATVRWIIRMWIWLRSLAMPDLTTGGLAWTFAF